MPAKFTYESVGSSSLELQSDTDSSNVTTSYGYDTVSGQPTTLMTSWSDTVNQASETYSSVIQPDGVTSLYGVTQQTTPTSVGNFSYTILPPYGSDPISFGTTIMTVNDPITQAVLSTTTYDFDNGVLVSTSISKDSSSAPDASFSSLRSISNYVSTSNSDGNGNTGTNVLDSTGSNMASANVVSSSDGLGNTTQTSYTSFNLPWCQVDANNVAAGKTCPASIPNPPPTPGSGKSQSNLGVTLTYYNSQDLPVLVTNPDGYTSAAAYTSSGLPYCTVDSTNYSLLGITCPSTPPSSPPPPGSHPGHTTIIYNPAGQKVSESDANGLETTYQYYTSSQNSGYPGSLETTTAPNGTVTTYTYDQSGNVVTSTESSSNGYTATTLNAYDSYNRLICTVGPEEYSKLIRCPALSSFPTLSSLNGTTNPNPGTTLYFYDQNGNKVATVSPTGGTSISTFDALGRAYCTMTPTDVITYLNDSGPTTKYPFACPASEPTTPPTTPPSAAPDDTTSYFGGNGNVIASVSDLGALTTNTYDSAGNKTSTKIQSGSSGVPDEITYSSYDADNRVLATCSDPSGLTTGDGPGICAKPSGTEDSETLNYYDPSGNLYCTQSSLQIKVSGAKCSAWTSSFINANLNTIATSLSGPASYSFRDASGNSIGSIELVSGGVNSNQARITQASSNPNGNAFCGVTPQNSNTGVVCGGFLDQVGASSCTSSYCVLGGATSNGAEIAIHEGSGSSVILALIPTGINSVSSISCQASTCLATGTSASGGPVMLYSSNVGVQGQVASFTSVIIPSSITGLSSVSCITVTTIYCVAIGINSNGSAAIYSNGGTSWNENDPGLTNAAGISCVIFFNSPFCLTSGKNSSNSLVVSYYSFSNNSWTNASTLPASATSTSSLSCQVWASFVCMVVGTTSSGSALFYDTGTAGTQQTLPTGITAITGISCTLTQNFCGATMVGANGATVMTTTDVANSADWTSQSTPVTPYSYDSISCVATTCQELGLMTGGTAIGFNGPTSQEFFPDAVPGASTSFSFQDPNGSYSISMDPDSNLTTKYTNLTGTISTTTDASGNTTTTCTYEATTCGGSSISPPSGDGSPSMTYETITPPNSSDPSGLVTTYTYLSGGLTDTFTTPGGVTTYSYNPDGTMASRTVTNNSGYAAVPNVTYTYNSDGSRASMTDGTGTTTYSYDTAGNLLTQSFTAGSGSNLSSYNGSNGTSPLSYTYYPDGKIDTVNYPIYGPSMTITKPKATYIYDGAGNMASVSDGLGTAPGNTISFTFDGNGNLITQTTGSGSTLSSANWTYDSGNNMILNSDYAQGITSGGPSPAGMTKSSSTLSPSSTTISSRLSSGYFGLHSTKLSTNAIQPSCSPGAVSATQDMGNSLAGSRNQNGQLTNDYMEISQVCGGSMTGNQYYNYDSASKVSYEGTTAQGSSPSNFCYQGNGALTYFTANNTSNNPQSNVTSVNPASELTSNSSPGSSNSPCSNLVGSTSNVNTYTYDSLGDRTSTASGTNTYSYGYNALGGMTSYTSGSTTNNFSYSGDGLEIAGQNGTSTTQLTWDSSSSMANIVTDGVDDYIYGPSGTPVEQINTTEAQSSGNNSSDNPTFMSFTPDISSWLITNTHGYTDNVYRYDAYGNLTGGIPGSVFGWQGQYLAPVGSPNYSGFDYMRARYYDPTTGVFTSMDPLYLSTDQAYSYATGDPVNSSDPSGMGVGIDLGFGCIGDCGPSGSSYCAFGHTNDSDPNSPCNGSDAAQFALNNPVGLGPVTNTVESLYSCLNSSSWNAAVENCDPAFGILMNGRAVWNGWSDPCVSSWTEAGNILHTGESVVATVAFAYGLEQAGAAGISKFGSGTGESASTAGGGAATGPGNGIGPGAASVNDPAFGGGAPWELTREGASSVVRGGPFNSTFYESASDGTWWTRDLAGHGGSAFKVYEATPQGLQWIVDANQYGDYISGKWKGDTGYFIPWSQLGRG
ncbi:MAG: hypothetical protein HKL80_01110 [Acidimicrobiales bacterium]|nr:hypothetical protein [Acidimicrobiales bacterium]